MKSGITPLEILFDASRGDQLPLPTVLHDLYGPLRFPFRLGRPYIICNFVSTLDGVVSLNETGNAGVGEISGFNQHDQMVMGILRAASDVVIAGASALREPPGHIWTAEAIYPPLIPAYQLLRANLGKPPAPLNVIVTGSGEVDLSLPIFQSGQVPVLILTTQVGLEEIQQHPLSPSVMVSAVKVSGPLSAPETLNNIPMPARLILIEGGPHMVGDFFAHQLIDEIFLAIAPQVAGRDPSVVRPGFIAGIRFAPENPLRTELIGVKRAGSFLFTRYQILPTRD